MKQEQNIARLKVYFRAIEVAFHEQKENFNVTMSYMSIYHLELLENFDHYAGLFEQLYRRRENSMIPLQGLFHFMKIMNLAQSTTEVVDMFQVLSDIDGVERIVDDTLNIKNGLNYAQFLEALLMIAHLKTKEAGGSPENPTEFTNIYKDTLEGIFSN